MPLHLHSLPTNIAMAKGLPVTISILKTYNISIRGNNLLIEIHIMLKHGSLLEADPYSFSEYNWTHLKGKLGKQFGKRTKKG